MVDSIDNLPKIEIAMILTNSESQVEKFAAMYKSLQPQEEFLSFIPPNFDLLQDIRNQGEIVISNRNSNASYNNGNSNGASVSSSQAQNIARRPIIRQMSTSGNGSGQWSESSSSPENLPHSQPQNIVTPIIPTTTSNSNNSSSFVVSNKSYASIVKPPTTTSIIGQCVLGSQNHVSVKPALSPSNIYF